MTSQFSYEKYMNLIQYPEHWSNPIPHEISKKVIYNTLSPCICVQSNPELDDHLKDLYNIDSVSMLFRYFGDYIQDRDQVPLSSDTKDTGALPGTRHRSDSLSQRQASECVRFTRSLENLVSIDSEDQILQPSDIDSFLSQYLQNLEPIMDGNGTPSKLLKHSIYHRFFITLSSINLSRYHSFHHPVVALIPIDITKNQGYEYARELLINFKNLNNTLDNFPEFININDILPVFVLCYDENSREQWESVQSLTKSLKKQLFVESVSISLFTSYENQQLTTLHSPIIVSLHEQIFNMSYPTSINIPSKLVTHLYDTISSVVEELMIPFMNRKLVFWDETVLQPRKSIFQSNKFFRRFISPKSNHPASHKPIHPEDSKQSDIMFPASSPEFLLRKLADWSFMLSDFKKAYSIYDLLTKDFESYPQYLAPCLEYKSVSLLMGAQNIITAKTIKTEVDPLMNKAIEQYRKQEDKNSLRLIHCILTFSDLLLSLSDTWVSSPLAVNYLTLIQESNILGPYASVIIWERIAYAYEICIDPRVNDHFLPKPEDGELIDNTGCTASSKDEKNLHENDVDNEWKNENKLIRNNMRSEGLTRFRKYSLYQLVAAKKWTEVHKNNQAKWCIHQASPAYKKLDLSKRPDGLFHKLTIELS
ncbi:unnamed protein product [Kluyveromyces dobzhanskii CBS 2104]|uniref:WGS project CCBQ000000000 data, contig 00058 n=1 Tax=Kluyveromyces dobzhanskii CBS 2104 TaxID=1427455 RepID=A0A0A8LD73_9SACH|nr:unnamed protein product [Kluyveromyces dobzhanskii CBS 2104]